MKRLEIPNVEIFLAAVEDEISHTAESRYYHRLHVVHHVLKGDSCYEAAKFYNHSPRSVENWVHQFTTHGFAGLSEGKRPGRPGRISLFQQEELRQHLLRSPREFGYDQNIWDGLLLSHHIHKQFSIQLQVRQCQNLFHRLEFTLQRPRRLAANANPEKQELFKKNSKHG